MPILTLTFCLQAFKSICIIITVQHYSLLCVHYCAALQYAVIERQILARGLGNGYVQEEGSWDLS